MHTVVIRRDIYEKYPWAAQSIFRAFCQAKARALQQSLGLGAPPVTLPWFFQEMDDTIQLMGKDFWPYGLTPNLKPLQKLIEYMGQQGLLGDDKSVAVGDLFAPNIF
jgi:4,5-dihydroxyphthalate decarboxylase